uniref:Uncharacterized protein n=1 Tax=Phage sp. ctGns7 TaxID=2828003 RepID=A0A8S5S8Z7_9VIRU|nr:MAG TPA: hypothetical protein [Phage sp. ctGns7]
MHYFIRILQHRLCIVFFFALTYGKLNIVCYLWQI